MKRKRLADDEGDEWRVTSCKKQTKTEVGKGYGPHIHNRPGRPRSLPSVIDSFRWEDEPTCGLRKSQE